MRLWLRGRREPVPDGDELGLADLFLPAQVEDVLAVEQRQLWGRSMAFGGRLRLPPGRAVDVLERRLAPLGYTPFLREEGGTAWVYALPRAEVTSRPNPLVNLGLFVATVFTTLLAGALWPIGNTGLPDLARNPLRLVEGAPFSVALLAILGVHELGHSLFGRRHGMPITLPYFIPVPPPFIAGTLGAVIRLRGPVRDRRALFDMAVAGPLAGLLVAVPLYVLGLAWSSPALLPAPGDDRPNYLLGFGILPALLARLVVPALAPGHVIELHPVGAAAWFGFLATALNLIPAGQLDGGHLVYALFGRRHALVSKLAAGMLVALGFLFGPTWWVWALLVSLMGFHHAPPMDDITPLDGKRRVLGVLSLVLLLLLLPPVPLSVS